MPIYLDSNATTQVHPEVIDAMLPYLKDHWQNPSSGYARGRATKKAIEEARERLAHLINANPDEIVFTGCGTESNNMAIKWLARAIGRKNSRTIVSAIEHSAVLRPVEAMEAVSFDVETVGVTDQGQLDLQQLEAAIDENRNGFASLMWANNETGVIQPLDQAAATVKEAGYWLHTDAIQAVGKTPVDVSQVPIDLLSLSGHKFHAPKGVGALYIRRGTPFEPMIRGGGQESGHRSGTENVPYIVGLGKAAELMQAALDDGSYAGVERRRDRFEESLKSKLGEGVTLNGHRTERLPNVCHASFTGCLAADLLPALEARGIECSAGSACMTGKNRPSHVQLAMGIPKEKALSSLRLSLSLFTTQPQLEEAAILIAETVMEQRS